MSEIKLFHQLNTCSRRAILRTTNRRHGIYRYNPRGDLLERLAIKNGMTKQQVFDQLQKERLQLLRDVDGITR